MRGFIGITAWAGWLLGASVGGQAPQETVKAGEVEHGRPAAFSNQHHELTNQDREFSLLRDQITLALVISS